MLTAATRIVCIDLLSPPVVSEINRVSIYRLDRELREPRDSDCTGTKRQEDSKV